MLGCLLSYAIDVAVGPVEQRLFRPKRLEIEILIINKSAQSIKFPHGVLGFWGFGVLGSKGHFGTKLP